MKDDFEVFWARPARHALERTAWTFRPLPGGGFRIKWSWWAWLQLKVLGRDATKIMGVKMFWRRDA